MFKLLFYFLILSFLFTQNKNFSESEFIKKVRSMYYQYSGDTTKTVKAQISSGSFDLYLTSKINDESLQLAPIDVNFSNMRKIKISKSKLKIETSDFESKRNDIIQVANAFLMTWAEFFVQKQIPDSAANYNFTRNKDRIFFSYITYMDKEYVRVVKEFDNNGILIKIEVQLAKSIRLTIQPTYIKSKDKLICVSWIYQKHSEKNTILEGVEVTLEHRELMGKLFPRNVSLNIQSLALKGKLYQEKLSFGNYEINNVLFDN